MLCSRLIAALTFALLSARLCAADGLIDAQAMFEKIRQQAAATVERAPRFTCMETVERSWYENRKPVQPGCDSDRAPEITERNLIRSDRLRLDVAVGSGQEIFAWHGEKAFRTEEIDEVVSAGPIGSGTYFSFLSSIFMAGTAKVYFQETRSEDGRQVALFRYAVALADSKFETNTGSGKQVMGYHGRFFADAVTGRLEKLEIVTDQMPTAAWVCRFSLEVEYAQTSLGGTSFELPTRVAMDVLRLNHEHTQTVTRYSQCQQFLGESVVRFDAEPAPGAPQVPAPADEKLPSGIPLDIRITSLISPATAWAGDAVEGELVHDIVSESGVLIAPKGTTAHGRLLRFESWVRPEKFYTTAIEFRQLSLPAKNYDLDLIAAKDAVPVDPKPVGMPQRIAVDNPPISNQPGTCRLRLNAWQAKLQGDVTHWVTK